MRYRDIVLFPAASNTPLLVARLRAGQIDVAFIRPPISDTEGLSLEPLVDEPTVMVLPAVHPLTRATSAPLNVLAKETFVLFSRELNPSNYDSIIAACQRAGF
jgi:DNA-binding transcriptional LysR family regulator